MKIVSDAMISLMHDLGPESVMIIMTSNWECAISSGWEHLTSKTRLDTCYTHIQCPFRLEHDCFGIFSLAMFVYMPKRDHVFFQFQELLPQKKHACTGVL